MPCFLYGDIAWTTFHRLNTWQTIFSSLEEFDQKYQHRKYFKEQNKTNNIIKIVMCILFAVLYPIIILNLRSRAIPGSSAGHYFYICQGIALLYEIS